MTERKSIAEKVEDIKLLAIEAAEISRESGIKHCWPWSHRWSMWESKSGGSWGAILQTKTCVKCGLKKSKKN